MLYSMKFYSLAALFAVLVVAGCGSKTSMSSTDTTTPTAEVAPTADTTTPTAEVAPTADTTTPTAEVAPTDLAPSCQKYVDFMKCVVEKTPEAARAQAQSALDQAMTQFKSLNADQQGQACDMATQALESNKDAYAQLGCEIK